MKNKEIYSISLTRVTEREDRERGCRRTSNEGGGVKTGRRGHGEESGKRNEKERVNGDG
ncbi:putative B-cell receptor CD22-like [Sesbania bispinosa]|nr:putative B-cell receptor CD22-like [Sesbania bispinosa]